MRHRTFALIAVLNILLAALLAGAQPTKVPYLGYMSPGDIPRYDNAFLRVLPGTGVHLARRDSPIRRGPLAGPGEAEVLHRAEVVHNVDISWNENWTGTAQVRNFRVEGPRLIISVGPKVGADGIQIGSAVLTWEKVE